MLHARIRPAAWLTTMLPPLPPPTAPPAPGGGVRGEGESLRGVPWRERRPAAEDHAGLLGAAAGLSLSPAARLQERGAQERHQGADRPGARARRHDGAGGLFLAKDLA